MSETENNKPGRTFAGLPYDWRRPTVDRSKSRLWNPDEPRFFPPKSFGWGWTINFYRLTHPFSHHA